LAARQKGVLVSRDGTEHNILKIKPPLVFSKENVDTLIDVLEEIMQGMLDEDKLEKIPNGHLSIFSTK
jgi:4-aminobutyrate aminotransferase-like enzyme